VARALADYDRAIALAPSAEAHYNRGALHYGFLGRRDLAARDFAEVLRLAPDHPERARLERAIREATP
jgi:tetratricopeptide (TPR) repeat protein